VLQCKDYLHLPKYGGAKSILRIEGLPLDLQVAHNIWNSIEGERDQLRNEEGRLYQQWEKKSRQFSLLTLVETQLYRQLATCPQFPYTSVMGSSSDLYQTQGKMHQLSDEMCVLRNRWNEKKQQLEQKTRENRNRAATIIEMIKREQSSSYAGPRLQAKQMPMKIHSGISGWAI
jgi:hypothetical protein